MKRNQTLFVGLFLVAAILFFVGGHAYGTSFLTDSIGDSSNPYDALPPYRKYFGNSKTLFYRPDTQGNDSDRL